MKKILTFLLLTIMAATQLNAEPIVDIQTSLGDIKIKLYDDTPIHRDNFLKLVKEGYYDGVLFHRVIKDFMVQTGDPQSKTADSTAMLGSGGPGYTLEAEIDYPKHFHKYGALAAARTGDSMNPQRRSSGSQFYIVTGDKQSPYMMEAMEERLNNDRKQQYFMKLQQENKDEIIRLQKEGDEEGLENLRRKLITDTEANVKDEKIPEEIKQTYINQGGSPHLDGQYTVFGEVISGMDVVEKIQNVETGRGDRPKEDIKIIKMTIVNQ